MNFLWKTRKRRYLISELMHELDIKLNCFSFLFQELPKGHFTVCRVERLKNSCRSWKQKTSRAAPRRTTTVSHVFNYFCTTKWNNLIRRARDRRKVENFFQLQHNDLWLVKWAMMCRTDTESLSSQTWLLFCHHHHQPKRCRPISHDSLICLMYTRTKR